MFFPSYSTKSFSYAIQLHGEGKYLLVLKFCEVFFEAAHKKVFDVVLNDVHPVVSDFDIFAQVGHATAHDVYVPFTISRGKLFLSDGGVSEVRNGRLKVSFLKGQLDNPKINAIVLVKGADVDEFPRLPPKDPYAAVLPLSSEVDVAGGEDGDEERNQKQINDLYNSFPAAAEENYYDEDSSTDDRVRRTSGPKTPDPYATEDNNYLITVLFIAVATIIPVVILKCRL